MGLFTRTAASSTVRTLMIWLRQEARDHLGILHEPGELAVGEVSPLSPFVLEQPPVSSMIFPMANNVLLQAMALLWHVVLWLQLRLRTHWSTPSSALMLSSGRL